MLYPDKNLVNADWLKRMRIRPFKISDAKACYRIRTESFVKIFYDKIGLGGVVAAVNDYQPEDFVNLAEDNPIYVVERGGKAAAFISGIYRDEKTVEVLFLYVRLCCRRQGIGSRLLRFFEDEMRENNEVDKIILNCAFPEYNYTFFDKMGYHKKSEGRCSYSGLELEALRLEKKLD